MTDKHHRADPRYFHKIPPGSIRYNPDLDVYVLVAQQKNIALARQKAARGAGCE